MWVWATQRAAQPLLLPALTPFRCDQLLHTSLELQAGAGPQGPSVQCFSEGYPLPQWKTVLCQGTAWATWSSRLLLAGLVLCAGLENRGLSKQLERVQDQSVFGFGGGEQQEGAGGAGGQSYRGKQALLGLCCQHRGPQPCLGAAWPPLLETGGRRLAALTYRHRTRTVPRLLCCLFPGRQVSSLPSPPAPPPFCEGCCRSLLLALLSRLMSLAAGSRAAWSHAGPVCNADGIGVCVWGGGCMATALALTPPKVQRQRLQRSARLDVCPFSLGNY